MTRSEAIELYGAEAVMRADYIMQTGCSVTFEKAAEILGETDDAIDLMVMRGDLALVEDSDGRISTGSVFDELRRRNRLYEA